MSIAVRPRRVPSAIPVAIALAWATAVVAQTTGRAALLHHDALIHSGLPFGVALVVFLIAWQVMVAAMMLPSTVPMVRHFTAASSAQENSRATGFAFLGGYALVWTVFGAAAFTFDLGVHRAVDSIPWLGAHQWYVSADMLAIAGLFQFSSLKDRCLDQCRHPAAFLLPRYRRGTAAAFRLGRQHGVFCLGCCWALMLVMFAAGVANLAWMALLGTVMAYEKVAARGERVVPVVGVTLLTWAALVAAHPAWLPHALAGVH